jgi:TPR repeat protein
MEITPEEREYFEHQLKKAEAGDTEAAHYLAGCYAWGDGVQEDPVLARKWYKVSADAGNTYSMYLYAIFLTHAYFDNSDSRPLHEIEEEVLYFLFTSLHLNWEDAFGDMCEVFYRQTNEYSRFPNGIFEDSYDAGLYARSLAETGTKADFEFFCGYCYQYGIFVRYKSDDRACDHFATAALLGHEKAKEIIEDLGEDGLFFSFEDQKYKRF